jgi:hypothetical protein
MRHGVECHCFGGDESAFAHLVATATIGDHDTAVVYALALLTPDHAFAAIPFAKGFGLAVLAVAHQLTRRAQPRQADTTWH